MRPTTLLTLVPAAVLTATVASAPPAQAGLADRYAAEARVATNQARAQHDLTRLRSSPCLTRYAERQAGRMAARGEMFHQDLQPILRSCGLSRTGENVAYGFRTGASAVRDGWMQSEAHRANLLSAPYRLVGLAAERSADGTWYVAQVFGRSA